jgi:hypothetical protein
MRIETSVASHAMPSAGDGDVIFHGLAPIAANKARRERMVKPKPKPALSS